MTNQKLSWIILIITIIVAMVIGLAIGYSWEDKEISDKDYYWACVDGCALMDIIYDEFDTTLNGTLSMCSMKCLDIIR